MEITQQYFIDKIIKGDFIIKNHRIISIILEGDEYLFVFQSGGVHFQQYETDYLGNYMFLTTNTKNKMHNAVIRKIGKMRNQ